MRIRLIAAILAATLLAPSIADATTRHTYHRPVASAPVSTGSLLLFSDEASAQRHCPNDTVVWLNTSSGIYHEKGMRWYGNTKAGAYVCRSEANGAGDRDTRNGQ